MATLPPATAHHPPAPSLPHPHQQNDTSSSPQLSWEGDRMFNIYIYDYFSKRGYQKSARELLVEADLPPDSAPPINARQGLLFEWWSVFWVLFSAKSNGAGPEDALLYLQHQGESSRRAAQQRTQPPPHQVVPMGSGSATPIQQPQHPSQPPMRGMLNGIQRPGYLPNGTLPNGVGPAGLQPGNIHPGPPIFPMGGPNPPQPNGIAGPSAPPIGQGIQSLSSPFQMLFPQHQHPPFTGPRPPNGAPFHSPTMGHSQAPVGTPGQQPLQPPQPSQQHPHPQPLMSQLGPPTPGMSHMNRAMLPPGGPPSMNPMMMPSGQPGGTPTQLYQTVGRPPSRTATPGQAGIPQPSPSLGPRQAPAPTAVLSEQALMAELASIPQPLLMQLKVETGLGNKDINQLSAQDKNRIVQSYRQRTGRKPGELLAPHLTLPQRGQQLQLPQQNMQGQQGQPQRKRNSTSPGEEHETLPRTDSSPPDRKRQRRSPLDQNAATAGPHGFTNPGQPQPAQGIIGLGQPPSGPSPQAGMATGMLQGQNMMIRQGPLMGGGPGGTMPMPPPPHPVPQPGQGMNPGINQMTGAPGPGMGPPMPLTQMNARDYQRSLQSIHKAGAAGSPAADPSLTSGNGPPPQGGPQFNAGALRMVGPKMMSSSPAMSSAGPVKDGANKDGKGPDGSPRNGVVGTGPGANPSTPGPAGQGQPGSSGLGPNTNIAPSPSAVLNNASGLIQQPPSLLGPPQPPSISQPPPQSLQPSSVLDTMTFDIMGIDAPINLDFDPNLELFRNGGDVFEMAWLSGEDIPDMK